MNLDLESIASSIRNEVLETIREEAEARGEEVPPISVIVILADMGGNPSQVSWSSDLNPEAAKELLEACVWRCVPTKAEA